LAAVVPLPHNAADLTGKPFGRLRAMSYAGRPPGFRRSAWNCLCDPDLGGCGRWTLVRSLDLTTGNSRSCGCFRFERLNQWVPPDPGFRGHPDYERVMERHKGAEFIDISGQTFGMLTVVDRAENRILGKTVHAMWNCICACGTPCVRYGAALRTGAVVSCSCMKHKGVALRSERVRQRDNAYVKRRASEDPRFVLERRLRARMRTALRRVGASRTRRLSEVLGYTYGELEAHLRTTLPEGCTWDDFMAGRLEIDHARPVWQFAYETEDCPGFREAWALSNLQLLTKQDHAIKSAASERERTGAHRKERRPKKN
jgi:hypothetical protein